MSVPSETPNKSEAGVQEVSDVTVKPASAARGLRFWLIFLALGFSLFLSPLELVSLMHVS